MMKIFFYLVALVALVGCAKKNDAKLDDKIAEADSIGVGVTMRPYQSPNAGSDEDAHGCKASAGYVYSRLSGECVRIFETGTRLDPYRNTGGAVMSAFVIFKGDRAELFVQTEPPMILTRKSEGGPFVNGKWELLPWKGYVLKKDGKILFAGK